MHSSVVFTELLSCNWSSEHARDQIPPLVYDELRRLARAFLARERSNHTLQPTALVHEAYLRLIDQRPVDWTNRAQLVGRGGGDDAADPRQSRARPSGRLARRWRRAGVAEPCAHRSRRARGSDCPARGLDALAAIDARKSRVVELKFFGGLTTAEVAEAMQLPPATIEREWSFSRAWLYVALADDAA